MATKRYIVEFGVRGGAHIDNLNLPNRSVAARLAASLVAVFLNDSTAPDAQVPGWHLPYHCPRKSWQSSTHFVSITRLTDSELGPASTSLWRK